MKNFMKSACALLVAAFAMTACSSDKTEFQQPVKPLVTSDTGFLCFSEEGLSVITDAVDFGEATLVIPDEIDGLPVVGVKHLGWSDAVHTLIFPDSVQYLDSLFSSFTYLEKVQFGSGVCNLRAEWFANNF